MKARKLGVIAVLLVVAVTGVVVVQRSDGDRTTIDASYPEGPLYQGATLYYAELGADVVTIVEDGKPRPFFRQPSCGPTAIAPSRFHTAEAMTGKS